MKETFFSKIKKLFVGVNYEFYLPENNFDEEFFNTEFTSIISKLRRVKNEEVMVEFAFPEFFENIVFINVERSKKGYLLDVAILIDNERRYFEKEFNKSEVLTELKSILVDNVKPNLTTYNDCSNTTLKLNELNVIYEDEDYSLVAINDEYSIKKTNGEYLTAVPNGEYFKTSNQKLAYKIFDCLLSNGEEYLLTSSNYRQAFYPCKSYNQAENLPEVFNKLIKNKWFNKKLEYKIDGYTDNYDMKIVFRLTNGKNKCQLYEILPTDVNKSKAEFEMVSSEIVSDFLKTSAIDVKFVKQDVFL